MDIGQEKSSSLLECHPEEMGDISQTLQKQIEQQAEKYVNMFRVPVEHLRRMTESFVNELGVGLMAHQRHPYEWKPEECCFKMLDACIKKPPTGLENGRFYALDFGGTSFRVVRVALNGDGTMKVSKKRVSLMSGMKADAHCPNGLMDANATATEMFDFFAVNVKSFMAENGDLETNVNIGFTFSFPCMQRKIDSAVLITWTKVFATGRNTTDPVEGVDVVNLINLAFKRNDVPARCNCVLNDAVGTLLSCAYALNPKVHPPCLVGMILGTGMNCCYSDESAPEFGYTGRIINIECGNFNKDLPQTSADCELDFNAVDTRGFQLIEKMCSGAYLGEICRLTALRIFADRVSEYAWAPWTLKTEHLASIVKDKTDELSPTRRIIEEVWKAEVSFQDLCIIKKLSFAVMDRSAAFAAVLIAGCTQKTGHLHKMGVTVGIDGSLYRLNPWYQERVRFHLRSIIDDSALSDMIHIVIADDGSGKGAAVLAAIID